jgi:hypothetical protein
MMDAFVREFVDTKRKARAGLSREGIKRQSHGDGRFWPEEI